MSHALPSAQLALLNKQSTLPFTANVLVNAAVVVTKWTVRRNTRLALKQLDISQLNDVGLTRTQALREAAKPFWQA